MSEIDVRSFFFGFVLGLIMMFVFLGIVLPWFAESHKQLVERGVMRYNQKSGKIEYVPQFRRPGD